MIIANYNYAQYLPAAIDSALALRWHDIEVIVVDDGSTDGSREVIGAYGSRITAVFQEHLTQRVARNRGYELSTGEAVIHLDSDDVLHPSLPEHVWRVWRPGISKVQVRMRKVSASGAPTGGYLPRHRSVPTPEQIERWYAATGAYPTPPGSGNVYNRAFLQKIFPIDERCGPATDSACLAAAAVLGDVVTVAESLVDYRIHGANTSNLLARPDAFARAVTRAVARFEFSQELIGARAGDRGVLRRNRHLLQLRVAAHRVTPGCSAFPGDRRGWLLRDAFTTLAAPGPESIGHRLAITVWALFALLAPAAVSRWAVRQRFRRF